MKLFHFLLAPILAVHVYGQTLPISPFKSPNSGYFTVISNSAGISIANFYPVGTTNIVYPQCPKGTMIEVFEIDSKPAWYVVTNNPAPAKPTRPQR